MAEAKANDPLQEEQGKKDSNTMSRTEDGYAPDEPTADIPTSLLQVRVPETPESTKDQASDVDTPRLESPKLLKPVLGKVQAKKRLMAFANKFNILPKVQNKFQADLAKGIKLGDKSAGSMNSEGSLSGIRLNTEVRTSPQMNSRPLSNSKPKKKPEEKILAIEEIRREESKSKQLLAEALAAANLDDESYSSKIGHRITDSTKTIKDYSKLDSNSDSQRGSTKSCSESKYERQRRGSRKRRSSMCVEPEEMGKELHSKRISSAERESSKRDKEKKEYKDKKDDNRMESNRARREDGKDKRRSDRERSDSSKTTKDARDRRSSFKEKKSGSLEQDSEVHNKTIKDKSSDNKKESEMIKSCSWIELKKCGITVEDILEIRRKDYIDRLPKIRTPQDYSRHFEQMLMLNDCRLKRSPMIVEGFDGPKEYPPESVKVTKRGKPQILYSENPRLSLFPNHQRLLHSVSEKRKEKMQRICTSNFSRINLEDMEHTESASRDWYPNTNRGKTNQARTSDLPRNVQLPKSKWDSEEEGESTAGTPKQLEDQAKLEGVQIEEKPECYPAEDRPATDEFKDDLKPIGKDKDDSSVEEPVCHEKSTTPVLESAGDEKLVSEYEQFMKMVCSDISLSNASSVPKEYSPKKASAVSTTSTTYDEFNLDTSLPEDNSFTYSGDDVVMKSQDDETISISNASDDRHIVQQGLKISCDQTPEDENSAQQESENRLTGKSKGLGGKDDAEDSASVPSDWENVRVKIERTSDENTDTRTSKRRKKRKRVASSTDSSTTTSSSDSEEERKKRKRKRKRKMSKDDSTSSDSDSSETSSSSSSSSSSSTSSSSSDSSSSEDRHKKRKKRKKKTAKRKKKAKRGTKTRKKRRRKISTDSSSSDSDSRKKKRSSKHKKSKSRGEHEAKESDGKDSSKSMRKATAERELKENVKVMESQCSYKRDKDQDMPGRVVSEPSPGRKGLSLKKDEERPQPIPKAYFEQWELTQMVVSQQKANDSASIREVNQECEDETEIRKAEKKENEDDLKDKCIREGASFPVCASVEDDMDTKKRRKREKEKRSSSEYLANWDRESDTESRLSRCSDRQKRDSWGETEFDTLNVLSLTQLEKEVNKRQLLADEWEVDSLEGAPHLTVKRKKSHSGGKKVDKEVRYDKITDTYISVEKQSSRESRKKRDPLCAIRIWEEEQEEGEKEEMMLQEQKLKRKRNSWDLQTDEACINEEAEANESVSDSTESAKTDSTKSVWAKVCNSEATKQTADMTITDHIYMSPKKAKKSRWDMGSQSNDKIELKQSVMWEEECSEWPKPSILDRKVLQEHAETLIENNAIKEEIPNVADELAQARTLNPEASSAVEMPDIFLRKSQNLKLLEASWPSDELSNEETCLPVIKEHPGLERLKDLFDLEDRSDKRGVQLYSPSSPALSQKSESNETSNDTTTNSSASREESTSQDSTTKEGSVKSDENSNSTSNESIQLSKFHEDDSESSNSSATKKEYEDSLDVESESKRPGSKLDVKIGEDLPTDFAIGDSFPSTSQYKESQMDIFADEYESDLARSKIISKPAEVVTATPPSTPPRNEESPEVKTTLKLIPKQFLIKRTTERPKSKPEFPLQDLSELLAIQKKRLEERFSRQESKSGLPKESLDEFTIEPPKETDDILKDSYTTAKHTGFLDIKQDVKTEAEIELNQAEVVKTGHSFEQIGELSPMGSKNIIAEMKKEIKEKSDAEFERRARSPSREQRRKSPIKRDYDKYNENSKDKKDSKYEERERSDRRDSRGSKEYGDRRRSSPTSSRGRRRRSTSPRASWERERSSDSRSRSWSRSRSKSPRRKDEKRPNKSRPTEEKKDRSGYIKDFKKYSSLNKADRDDGGRRKYASMEKDHGKDSKSYDAVDTLSKRSQEHDSHKDSRDGTSNRFRREETDRSSWPYEGENMGAGGSEPLESYSNEQDLLGFGYDDRSYYDENIRDIFEGPMSTASNYSTSRRGRLSSRRDRQWDKDVEASDSDRHGRRSDKYSPPRNRSPGRTRRSSPHRKSYKIDRLRRTSRSRSKSWSRSRSRSRSTSKTRVIRTRSRSRSRSGSRSRNESTSRSTGRSTDVRRASSLDRSSRDKKDEGERGRRIETIVQSVSGIARQGAGGLESELHIEEPMGENSAGFQYMNESEAGNEYYYTENNLTYPPCIDDSTRNSPKRLSLDDRLELELGIKKQQESAGVSAEYPDNYNPTIMYPPTTPQQQVVYRQQPTVVQVGNVLQVVPGDFNGLPGARKEMPSTSTAPVPRASSQVVRVGNVLQVVPTSLDWNSGQSSSVDQPGGVLYPTVPQSVSVPPTPVSVPVPVPVPMPVPIPPVLNNSTPVSTLSPVPISMSIPPPPIPVPIPIPPTAATFIRTEPPPQKSVVQPVYNYEAILEARRKEREERKRLREMRRKEKERKRIERINRRALRLLEKTNPNAVKSDSPGQKLSSTADPSVLKALTDGDEAFDKTEADEQVIATEKDEQTPKTSAPAEDEEAAPDEDEEEEEEEEPEVEEDEEEEEEPEEDDEEEEDDEAASSSRAASRKSEPEDTATVTTDTAKTQEDLEPKDWSSLPPAPLKGILVASGFRKLSISNGNLDDLSTGDDESDEIDKEEAELDKNSRSMRDDVKTKVKTLLSKRRRKSRKSVQFADGIKPGEGTSPSGGEGDMPSPPPPSSAGTRSSVREMRRSSRKSRKQEKRAKPPKTKKKVKVKIIKLKKPRITPLTAMMMDDSDELDDKSPPPPPPGSPPPPHLWPSYLSAYNSAVRTPETSTPSSTASSTAAQPPPPPTPLPLLVPPPPLNYTIQPCSKA